MARIYKRTDRIEVKIDDITVKLAPLSLDQKTEIQQLMLKAQSKMDIQSAQNGIRLAIKYSLKGLHGVVDSDLNPYQLQFKDDLLTNECVDDLLNLELKEKLVLVCSSLMNGIPTSFTDNDNNPLAGVEIVKPEKVDPEKKS